MTRSMRPETEQLRLPLSLWSLHWGDQSKGDEPSRSSLHALPLTPRRRSRCCGDEWLICWNDMSASSEILRTAQRGGSTIQDIHRTVTGLRAIPYMGSDSPFLLSDRNGNKTVGYSSKSASNPEGYAGFEDVFRGSEEDFVFRTLLTFYLPLLSDCSSVIDIGCGRGEMLDVLAKAGIAAVGVDTDESMIKRCERKGHTVQHEDALTYLSLKRTDRSVPCFAAQVIEHLAYGEFIELLQQSLRVLEPGGLMVAETVNPHAAHSFKTFWVDMTHQGADLPRSSRRPL